MARARVQYQLGPATAVIGEIVDEATYRAAQRVRGRAMSNIRSLGRVDTGEMIRGLQVRKTGASQPLWPQYTVESTARHTGWQEDGTRAHGPVRADFLVFQIRGAGPVIFAKWVRGVPPGHFMRRAMDSATVADFTP